MEVVPPAQLMYGVVVRRRFPMMRREKKKEAKKDLVQTASETSNRISGRPVFRSLLNSAIFPQRYRQNFIYSFHRDEL